MGFNSGFKGLNPRTAMISHTAPRKPEISNATWEFYVLLTVQQLGIIFVNNQLDAQFFFIYVYLNSHIEINILEKELWVKLVVYKDGFGMLMAWYYEGKAELLVQIPAPVRISPPQIPHIITPYDLDIWLAVHHSITFLLFPTWYTNQVGNNK